MEMNLLAFENEGKRRNVKAEEEIQILCSQGIKERESYQNATVLGQTKIGKTTPKRPQRTSELVR